MMKEFLVLFFTVSTLFAQRTPLKFNGVVVNNPDLTNTTGVTYTVNGSIVSIDLPQDIRTNASPTFSVLSIDATAYVNSLVVTQSVSFADTYLTSRAIIDDHGTERTYAAGTNGALRYYAAIGTTASPVTNVGPYMKISKTENLNVTNFVNGASTEQSAALVVISQNNPQSGVQVTAIEGIALTQSTNNTGGANPDSGAIVGIGVGLTNSVGVAAGGYFKGHKKSPLMIASLGAEFRSSNQSGVDDDFPDSGIPTSMGTWATADTKRGAAAYVVGGLSSGVQWDVGFGGVNSQTGSNYIKTAFIADNTSSPISYRLKGSHTTGIDFSGATISGNAIISSNYSVSGLGAVSAPSITLTPVAANASAITSSGYNLTGSSATPLVNATGVWNTSGGPTLLSYNITNTASTGAKFIDFLSSGSSQFSVSSSGSVTINGASSYIFNTLGGFSATSNGRMRVRNSSSVVTNTAIIFGLHASPAAANTLASANTIAPLEPITFVDGSTTIKTITAPPHISGTGGSITIIPATGSTWVTDTTGNIALATTAVPLKALTLYYDSGTTKWYPSY